MEIAEGHPREVLAAITDFIRGIYDEYWMENHEVDERTATVTFDWADSPLNARKATEAVGEFLENVGFTNKRGSRWGRGSVRADVVSDNSRGTTVARFFVRDMPGVPESSMEGVILHRLVEAEAAGRCVTVGDFTPYERGVLARLEERGLVRRGTGEGGMFWEALKPPGRRRNPAAPKNKFLLFLAAGRNRDFDHRYDYGADAPVQWVVLDRVEALPMRRPANYCSAANHFRSITKLSVGLTRRSSLRTRPRSSSLYSRSRR